MVNGNKAAPSRGTAELPPISGLAKAIQDLFAELPDVHFFVKNRSGAFLFANRAFARKCGFDSPSALIGLTDLDVWPKYLGEKYRKDDEEIFRTGHAQINAAELVFDGEKSTHWYSTTKFPILGDDGAVHGIAGITRDLKLARVESHQFREMSEVFDYIIANFREPINIKGMAAIACLSISQFERKFKTLFNMTPRNYLAMVRLHYACDALVKTPESISIIADQNGFYDLSHLTRLFRRRMGTTPREYRKRYSSLAAPPENGLFPFP